MGELTGVKQGDYVYIDSGPPSHGFLVVGFGPALKCDSEALDGIYWSGSNIAFPNAVRNDFDNPNYVTGQNGETIEDGVPYVVDWGGQRNTPRPFYCSRLFDPQAVNDDVPFFNHSYWRFITVPDVINVPGEIVYYPPFDVSATGVVNNRCG